MKMKMVLSALLLAVTSPMVFALSDECAREIAVTALKVLFTLWVGTVAFTLILYAMITTWLERVLETYFRGERR